MKTLTLKIALFGLATLLHFGLAAQTIPSQGPAAAIPTLVQTQNWMHAAQTCFGQTSSAAWMNAFVTEESTVWLDENQQLLVITSELNARSFEETAEEAANAFFSGNGAQWQLRNEKEISGGSQIEYRVSFGGQSCTAVCLLLPGSNGGTVVMAFSPEAETLQTESALLAAALRSDKVAEPLLANTNK